MSKKIRSLIFLLFLMMLSMITYPAVKTPSEVTFDGEVYKQAYQDGDGVKTNRVTEYLRKGENHDNYAKMIAIWEYPEVKDLEGFTGNLIKDLSQGKIVDSVKDVKEATKIVGRTIKEGAIIGGEIVGFGKNTIEDKNWVIGIDDPLQKPEERTLITKIKIENNSIIIS